MVAVGFWSGERVIQSWLRWLYARAEEVMEEPYAWETVRTIAIELLNRRMLHRRALASLIQETYRRQIPDVGGLLTYVPADVMTSGTPAAAIPSVPSDVPLQGEFLLSDRKEARRPGAGVIFIDVLRQVPKSEE
jgi:hypothetical protein